MTATREPPLLDVFYPIVPDIAWLRRLVPLGVRTIQLRLKDASADEVRRQILAGMELCIRHDCQLIVNDYWREAIALGADFVHLGQEDLATADIAALKDELVRIGISTHDDAELDRALAIDPDYIAIGPIYQTTSKAVTHASQGLDRISEWRDKIGPVALVAIGGITLERAPSVISAGADSVAVISDVTSSADPEARVRAWMEWAESLR